MALEIEDKFDVPVDFQVPELSGVRGCGEAAGPKSHQLVAIYFDTADLRLAARGITLRRRRGGADPGWHLKLPKAKGVRQEITHPLTRSTKIVPAALAGLVQAYTRGAELIPVAELDTRRSVTVLHDVAGNAAVEVADDRVKGTVFGEEPRIERWREVEAELIGSTDPAVLRRVGKRLRKAGAAPATSASKLARLLNGTAPKAAPRPVAVPGSAGEVVLDYLTAQVTALLAQDPRVRQAGDDAVHQMRVACRRLRSALKAFKSIVAANSEVAAIQGELQWLGNELGTARDLEVIRARFARHFAALPDALVVGPITDRLGDDLLVKERAAYEQIRQALSDQRYFDLLDALDALLAAPPFTKQAKRPADAPLAAVAEREWRRVTDAYDVAQAKPDEDEREIAMHDVRKAAKRARYTAEVLGMRELAKIAEEVQETLGTYQDGVVTQELLAREAENARLAGEDTFTYGVLTGLERATGERAHVAFPDVWTRTTTAARAFFDGRRDPAS
ncbi:hypothetical protein C1I98_21100 [Spongiactinospora gelatinilytica]|uniref:CHAD domain-containing protein n=1 Tax=Spongiactinospora gelatinilytica TaxID=2666298 RepID=A0A2W2G0P9_9ACTN|nr:CYTH and CHAD domain-containing protein [Spongiactinospora gelatinilytica]PZG41532.1 hypothetical protein C1I98_21100 [Spongiactinospora gelatinilytica]